MKNVFLASRTSGTFSNIHFSDFMQKGASLSADNLLKLITRGRTSRMSADPLLEFFRPLEAWLEAQNRDETVSNLSSYRTLSILFHFQIIGWSSNMDDVSLYQNLALSRASDNGVLNILYIFSLTLSAFVIYQNIPKIK